MAGTKVRGAARRDAYASLRSQILSMQLPPGAAVSENDLAAELGVSRTPVREALMLLAEEKLVEVIPQVGTFVARVDLHQVSEAQFLREAVELASLRSIEGALDPGILAELQDNLDQQDSVKGDVARFFALDEDFHRGLLRLAGHGGLWSTVVSAKGHLDRARQLGVRQQRSIETLVGEHRAILTALEGSDMTEAEGLLRAHVRAIFADIVKIQQNSPELFVTDSGANPRLRLTLV